MKLGNRVLPYVGLLVIDIEISFSRSLKDKRQVVRSILERVLKRWNVSAMDIGPSDSHSSVVLAFSGVGTTSEMITRRLNAVYGFVEKLEFGSEFEILDYIQEVNCYGDFPVAENKQADSTGDFPAFGVQNQE